MCENEIREIMYDLVISRKRNPNNKRRWKDQFEGKTKRKLNDDQILSYWKNKINKSKEWEKYCKKFYRTFQYKNFILEKKQKQLENDFILNYIYSI